VDYIFIVSKPVIVHSFTCNH